MHLSQDGTKTRPTWFVPLPFALRVEDAGCSGRQVPPSHRILEPSRRSRTSRGWLFRLPRGFSAFSRGSSNFLLLCAAPLGSSICGVQCFAFRFLGREEAEEPKTRFREGYAETHLLPPVLEDEIEKNHPAGLVCKVTGLHRGWTRGMRNG